MSNKKYDLYIASPLFCDDDNRGLDIIEKMLDEMGITYFSPRRDSKLDLRGAKTPEERNEIAEKIFRLNEEGIHQSRMIIVNTTGTRWNNAIYSDAGTMIEAGIAIQANIPIVSYNFFKYGLNIMMSQKVVYHCDNTSYENYDELSKIKEVLDLVKSNPQASPSDLRSKFYEIKDRELV